MANSKTIRTMKIKIGESKEFDTICAKFLSACNWISPIVYSTKEVHSLRLHASHYTTIRKKFGLTSQLACSSFRYVTAAFLSQRAQKIWHSVVFKRQVIPIIWKRDFSFTKTKGLCFWGNPVSINDNRIPPVEVWKDSKLQQRGKDWYLLLCYDIVIPETKTEGCIVGVDSGIKRVFTATNSANSKTFTFSGGSLNHKRRCIRQVRSAVQSKRTKSSKRLLKRMSRHEAKITTQLIHVASKKLVQYAQSVGARKIVMEKLSNIRESSRAKGKNMQSRVNRWPYAMGQFMVNYKAKAKGIASELVSPKNTSRGCPLCGHIDSRNRNGLKFRCLLCNYRGDSDRVASINIRNRSVVTRHNLVTTGRNNTPEGMELSEVVSGCHDQSSNWLHPRFTPKTQSSLVVG